MASQVPRTLYRAPAELFLMEREVVITKIGGVIVLEEEGEEEAF